MKFFGSDRFRALKPVLWTFFKVQTLVNGVYLTERLENAVYLIKNMVSGLAQRGDLRRWTG